MGKSHAQQYYTAPLGPHGTWVIYEYNPTSTVFFQAREDAAGRAYAGVPGHLISISSKDEDLWARRLAGYGNFWIGLTDQLEFGGTETGEDSELAKWGGWRGDPNEIPLDLRPFVQPNGWVWVSGEPYDYQVWINGEPNNYSQGEGAAVKIGTGWYDYPMGAFGQPAWAFPYLIEYDTRSDSPDPQAIQLGPMINLPGVGGAPGFIVAQVFRNNLAISNIEDLGRAIRSGTLKNPVLGTAPAIHFHDPDAGGGGLFALGRQTFPGNLAGDDNNFQLLIQGTIRVPAGQGGPWTFNIHADDGFAFQIHGAQFTSAHGNGFIDFLDRGTLTHPEPTADADTRGVVNLPEGDYPFTFMFFELGGGAFCELSAAPGVNPTDGSTSQWRLVGAPESPLKFVAAPPPPVITQQPVSRSVFLGQSATLSVEATGTPPFSYQWRHQSTHIEGANKSSFTVKEVLPADVGDYSVVVANGGGAITSRVATLSLRPTADLSVRITSDPMRVGVGQQTTFGLLVKNAGPQPAGAAWTEMPLNPPLRILSMASSQGSCDPSRGRCDLGPLAVGAEAWVTLVATAEAAMPAHAEHVTVRSTVFDNNLENNTDSIVVQGVGATTFESRLAENGTVVLKWEGEGKLQSTTVLDGAATIWTDMPGVSNADTLALQPNNPQSYYRLVPPPVSLPSVTIYQTHLHQDGIETAHSDWGAADITFLGSSNTYYFNLGVGTNWPVRNVPVISFRGWEKPQTVTVNFKLTESGTPVSNVLAGFSWTTNLMEARPAGSNVFSVRPREVDTFSGTQGTNLFYRPATDLQGGSVRTWASAKPVFPNQEQGRNECAPAAVANSLQYLNTVFALGMPDRELTVEKMKEATGWNEDGAPNTLLTGGWAALKAEYMASHSLPIDTEITKDPVKAMQALARGCDVEMDMMGHAAAIVAIADIGDGEYALTLSHDVRQAEPGTPLNNGGTITEIVIFDSDNPLFFDDLFGSYWSSDFNNFVIECPHAE